MEVANCTISFNEVEKARENISKFIHKTPVYTNSTINNITGRSIFFKAENFQKTGSFKARGALNTVTCMMNSDLHPEGGSVTCSSGNHGQALAWAANTVGLPSSVVIPRHAPLIKKEAIKEYGANLIECGSKYMDRVTMCQKAALELNYDIIPSSDHPDVIAGQGTIALEFFEAIPNLDALFVSVGGGGMIAGIAIAAKHINPDIKVYAVEPDGKILEKCLRSGQKLWPAPPQYLDTIADGIMRQSVADVAWPYMLENVEKEVFTVNDEEIVNAMKFVFERMKLVIETSAAATVAAVMSDQFKKLDDTIQNVGVILCGGNVDINNLPW
ncbi:hypothetical protein LOTGIDRAFT_227146 [Lottia gigantea]|uniref:L-serine ammonia-lyase n=1 Tax=Lottia gigantea TaxID=225164 RepID=V4AGE8_LOTGI|nr:hypothetical protein LOTGIDRAFT_227146 [Lottia gigantea]ESO95952.1 hypothetical protein LOTGIDRAFT_227146 [Lottia gigantea]